MFLSSETGLALFQGRLSVQFRKRPRIEKVFPRRQKQQQGEDGYPVL